MSPEILHDVKMYRLDALEPVERKNSRHGMVILLHLSL